MRKCLQFCLNTGLPSDFLSLLSLVPLSPQSPSFQPRSAVASQMAFLLPLLPPLACAQHGTQSLITCKSVHATLMRTHQQFLTSSRVRLKSFKGPEVLLFPAWLHFLIFVPFLCHVPGILVSPLSQAHPSSKPDVACLPPGGAPPTKVHRSCCLPVFSSMLEAFSGHPV